jgi:hypothetical protein
LNKLPHAAGCTVLMLSYNATAYGSFMDDLILAGAVSIIGLYAATVIFTLMELQGAAVAGDSGRVAAILGIVLLFLVAYAGTGVWLQKNGRI